MSAWEKELQLALLPRFRLIRRLGRGITAMVYLAADQRNDRHVALKVLLPEHAHGFVLDRFRREMGIIARLTHPNILPLLDSGEAASLPYFIMPYVPGEALASRLVREARLPVHDAVRLTCEVADALDYAHAAGVLHRDIKPANILLVVDHAVVADFGAGRLLQTAADESFQTQPGVMVGTPLYVSPEQVAGDTLDGRSDQYSLGIVLHEMLTGTVPFSGRNAQSTMAKRLTTDPPPLRTLRSDVPEHVERAVLKALSRDPAERFANAGGFAAALVAERSVETGSDAPTVQWPGVAAHRVGASVRDADGDAWPALSARRIPSVAVLPFASLSSTPDDEHLAAGLTEELTSALGRLRSVQVVARASALRFREPVDVRMLGDRLGAQAVLEGSVRRADSRIRVTARLLSTMDGRQLWAEQFDRESIDVFAVQEAIANAIVEALATRLPAQPFGARVAVGTTNVAAHELYLRGRFAWNKRTVEQLERSVGCFERAIDLDPAFAAAHAGLADAYLSLCIYGTRAPREVMPAAQRAAERALKIDPTAASARTTLACLLAIYEWDWSRAEQEFLRAVTLEPSYTTAHQWYAVNLLAPLGRFDEAMARAQAALQLDPLSGVLAVSVGVVLFAARRYDESVRQYERTIEMDPNFGLAHYFLGQALMQVGAPTRAVASFERAIELSGRSPEILSALGHARALDGDVEGARRLLDELGRRAVDRYVSPYHIAQVHLGLGAPAQALDWLERALEARAAELSWIGVRGAWDPLRANPRFGAIERALRLR